MDGVSRVIGVGPTVKLGGRTLTVNSKILRHYAEMEAEVIKRRGNPFDLVRQAKDAMRDAPELMRSFVAEAFDAAIRWKVVSQQDIHDFLGTLQGTIFAVWLAVRDNDPASITLEWTTTNFMDEMESIAKTHGGEAAAKWQASIEAALDQASGDDEVGNSTGSPQSGEVASQPAA